MALDNVNINGVSLWRSYGIYLDEESYRSVLTCPRFKKLPQVDWPEENGVQVDLSNPVLEPRNLSLLFHYTEAEGLRNFLDLIQSEEPLQIELTQLGFSISARFLNCNYSGQNRLGQIRVSLEQDLVEITHEEPLAESETVIPKTGYAIDEIDMSRFCCHILNGTLESLMQLAAHKENLSVSNSAMPGQIYLQQGYYKHEALKFELNLLMYVENSTMLRRCWNALFSLLTSPNEHILYIDDAPHLRCYYDNCRVSRVRYLRTGRIWLEMKVQMRVVD